jgi:hypothetical protein
VSAEDAIRAARGGRAGTPHVRCGRWRVTRRVEKPLLIGSAPSWIRTSGLLLRRPPSGRNRRVRERSGGHESAAQTRHSVGPRCFRCRAMLRSLYPFCTSLPKQAHEFATTLLA